MVRQRRTESLPASRIITARYKGKCLCGKSFAAGEQIEFDPVGRQTRCLGCYQKQLKLRQQNISDTFDVRDDSQFAIVERLKQIRALPTPLSPRLKDEYDSLLKSLKIAPQCSPSTKLFLQSSANCKYKGIRLYAVKLGSAAPCLHCRRQQRAGCIVLMEFPSRKVHCIGCDCK